MRCAPGSCLYRDCVEGILTPPARSSASLCPMIDYVPFHGVLDRIKELRTKALTLLVVPVGRFEQLGLGFGQDFDHALLRRASRARRASRTSPHGLPTDSPAIARSNRRWSSLPHASPIDTSSVDSFGSGSFDLSQQCHDRGSSAASSSRRSPSREAHDLVE